MERFAIATFNKRANAEPVQRRLAEAGLQAETHDEQGLERFWFVSKPSRIARIEVPVDQFERANQIIASVESEGLLRDAIRCPECHSLRVQYPQFAHKSVLPNIVMGLFAAVGREREFYCENCHYTWPKEGTKASALRPHMAPYYFIEGVEQTSLRSKQSPAHEHA